MTGCRNQRTQQRACRGLAWGILAFACAQLGLLVVMERRHELHDPEYGNRLACLRQRLADEPGRPLVLMLGTSRTEMGLRPALLEPATDRGAPLVFNFGLAGNGPVKQALYLRRLLDAGIRPAHLFLEVLPGNLSIYLEPLESQGAQTWVSCSDLPVLARYCERPRKLYRSWCFARLTPCVSHRLPIQNCIVPGLIPRKFRREQMWGSPDGSGWMSTPVGVTDEMRRQNVACNQPLFAPHLKHLSVGQREDQAMRDMLTLCRSGGIAVTLVLMPESGPFRGWYSAESWALIQDYLERMHGEFGVPVVNARDWVPDEGFRDSHHLHNGGAEVFTHRLHREVLLPMARGEPFHTAPQKPGTLGRLVSTPKVSTRPAP